MSGKKKRTAGERRCFAGETAYPIPLSPSEERDFMDRFTRLQKRFPPKEDSPFGASPAVTRRRETAARLCAGFFLRLCDGPRETVLDALMTAISLPLRMNEWFGEPISMSMGAACWFLDYVEDQELKEELLEFLPPPPEDDDYLVFAVEDPAWPREVLLSVSSILRERKKERQREFRCLLKLIRREDAAALRIGFRDAVLDYFQRFYEIETRVRPQTEPERDVLFPMASPLLSARRMFDREKEKPPVLPAKEAAESTPGIRFLLHTADLVGRTPEKIQSVLFFRRATEKLAGFTVPDPYAVCAAFYLLESEDDLLCDLNTLTDAVLLCAQRQLPWAMQEALSTPHISQKGDVDHGLRFRFQPPEESEKAQPGDEIEADELLSEEQLFYLATGTLLPRRRVPSEAARAWFQKQGLSEARARELSMAVLFAGRSEEKWDWEEELLDCGDPERAALLGGRADVLLEEGWEPPFPSEGEYGPDSGEGGGVRSEEAEASGTEEQDSGTRAADLARQLKDARGALHDAEQAVRQLQERLARQERDAARNRMELSSLRDALFRLKSVGAEEEEAPSEDFSFPWTGRRRILVFGGHNTWSKTIRPLLPGVRFCDREALPDLNAIKNADIVWIQPNALSHKFFYRIIETARKEEIEVRYFGFASARKCAEQLVETELAAEAD